MFLIRVIKHQRKKELKEHLLVTLVLGTGFKHVKMNTTLQKIEYILTIYPLSFLRETIVYN